MAVTRAASAAINMSLSAQLLETLDTIIAGQSPISTLIAGGSTPVGPGQIVLADGVTGAGKIRPVYMKQISIAASANTVLDLTALTYPDGAALSFAAIFAILVQNLTVPAVAANGHDLAWGAGSNPVLEFAYARKVKAGGADLIVAGSGDPTGYPVTGSTAMNLKFLSVPGSGETGACVFNLVILGQ